MTDNTRGTTQGAPEMKFFTRSRSSRVSPMYIIVVGRNTSTTRHSAVGSGAPGRIVVYQRNVGTNELLYKAGLDLLVIPSSELSRGRGGPRCMSMPLWRDEAPAR